MATIGVPKWVYWAVGGGTAAGLYTLADVIDSRRNAVPTISSADIVSVERAHHRVPCTVLEGFDLVINNYYVKEAPKVAKKKESTWRSLFSNDSTQDSSPSEGEEVSTRLVERDGKPSRARVAASLWPPGTQKYSAVVLEPSRGGKTSTGTAPHSDPLRGLADIATDQSLIRCNALSNRLDMTCDGDPSYLGAPYLRVMLAGLLYLPSTLSSWRVAVLGVAGGSLPNFLQRYFSRKLAQLDLVDIEPQCFKAAIEELGMANQAESVRLLPMDAMKYLQNYFGALPLTTKSGTEMIFSDGPDSAPLDLLFVDLYIGSELSNQVSSSEFLSHCKRVLSSQGVAVFNIPRADSTFVKQCGNIFGSQNVFVIPTPLSSNRIVITRRAQGVESGLTGRAPSFTHRQLYYKAKNLQKEYHLPYDLANHFPVWWRFW